MKAFAAGESESGQGGGSVDVAIWKRAVKLLENFGQGCFAVAISMTVAPTDQTSAPRPWPLCRPRSGARS